MISDEERREVALKLRGLADGHSAVECSAVAKALALGYEVHGTVAAFSADAVAHVADLIEPQERTCHMLPVQGGGYGCDGCYTWFCGLNKPPRYCPRCDAKVVD